MLEVQNIAKQYSRGPFGGKEMVLGGVSFNVDRGEIASITGRSGVGKSTIARIVCGTLPPDSGKILFRGDTLVSSDVPFNKKYRTDIQLIPQQPGLALDPRQRIGDAVCEPMLACGLVRNKVEAMEKCDYLLDRVWLHREIKMRYPSQISSGQAQRAVIARALALGPKLLVADEATSMLDISSQAQIIRILLRLQREEGMSILLISHDMDLVNAVSDKIYQLENAKITKL